MIKHTEGTRVGWGRIVRILATVGAVAALALVGQTGSASATAGVAQTITFTVANSFPFGSTPTLSATSDSGLPVSFTSTTPGVCTITAGGALTPIAVGVCTINADQAGDTDFAPAATVSKTTHITPVVPGAPTIGTATAGDAQATVTFTAPVSDGGIPPLSPYKITRSPGGLTSSCNAIATAMTCTVTGLTNGTAYTFTVQAQNVVDYGPASAASNSVTPIAGQTITFANPGPQDFGTSPTLTATSTSGLPVTFTSTTTSVCTITSGGTLSFVTFGLCTITADQDGDASFAAAPAIQQSFVVSVVAPGAPTIGTASAGDGQASVSFAAPASDGGLPINAYYVTASPGGQSNSCPASPCTVSGLTNGTAYTFTVMAQNTAGLVGLESAASNSVIPMQAQTITFTNPGPQDFGTSPTLSATSSAGLEVFFLTSTRSVCSITSTGTLTFVATGTCTVHASSASPTVAAALVVQSFTVNAVAPGAPTIGVATGGDRQATVSFTTPASDGGAPIMSYRVTTDPSGGSAAGCTESPCTVTGLTNGTAYTFTVAASTSTLDGALSASSNSVTPQGPQTITFTLPATGTAGDTEDLAATASSGLAVSYVVGRGGTGDCSISGDNVLSLTRAGTCVIDAFQTGDAAYLPADQVEQTITIQAANTPTPTPTPTPSDGTPTPTSSDTTTPTPTPTPSSATPTPSPTTSASSTGLNLSDQTPNGQGQETFSADGLQPGSTASFYLHSDPYFLGTATANAAGVATLTVALPAGFTGAHTIEVRATAADGTALDLSQPITIAGSTADDTGLASTGASNIGPLLSLAGILVVTGLAILAIGRRRNRSRPAG